MEKTDKNNTNNHPVLEQLSHLKPEETADINYYELRAIISHEILEGRIKEIREKLTQSPYFKIRGGIFIPDRICCK